MSERETASEYTREYIKLRKETERLLREGRIDQQEANHRNRNAKQFLMFARYQLESAKKASNLKRPASSPHKLKRESEDNWHPTRIPQSN
jgi:plasmid maintenance system killer protein